MTLIKNYWPEVIGIPILLAILVMTLTGCAHRARADQPEAPPIPVNKPIGQAEALTPAVVYLTATGVIIAAAGIGLGASGFLPPKPATAIAVTGAGTAVGIMAAQQLTAWIPWLLLALVVCGLGWLALHTRKVKALWVKDRTKLKHVANTFAITAVDGTKAPTFASLADDLAEHLK